MIENLYLIVAYVLGTRAIGLNNKLLWEKLRSDMRNFIKVTKGAIVIVGKNTNDSFDRQLVGRDIIIVTSDPTYWPTTYEVKDPSKIHVRASPEEALVLAEALAKSSTYGIRKIFVIGGEQIYSFFLKSTKFLPYEMYLTEVDADGLEGDTHFPLLPKDQYDEIDSVSYKKNAETEDDFDFVIKTVRFSTFGA